LFFDRRGPMDRIARNFLLVAAVALASLAPSALADGVSATVAVDGSYAFGNNGYGIPPYGGTLNGQPAEFYCVDFSHDISGGMSWTAIVTPITVGGDYSATYLGNPSSPTYLGSNGTANLAYLVFAYIITEMQDTNNQTTQAEDQWAIWAVTDGGYDPYGIASAIGIIENAETAIADGYNGAGWEILTPGTGQYGQEFLVQTPEPSTLLLLGLGLGALLFWKRRSVLAN
jgi:hypothetical protein